MREDRFFSISAGVVEEKKKARNTLILSLPSPLQDGLMQLH